MHRVSAPLILATQQQESASIHLSLAMTAMRAPPTVAPQAQGVSTPPLLAMTGIYAHRTLANRILAASIQISAAHATIMTRAQMISVIQ